MVRELTIEELTELLSPFGVNIDNYVGHISTNNKMLRKVGTDELYQNPIDLKSQSFNYEESDVDVESEREPES